MYFNHNWGKNVFSFKNKINVNFGKFIKDSFVHIKAKLEATKARLEANDLTGMTKDDIVGDLLHTTAVSYFAELDMMNYV